MQRSIWIGFDQREAAAFAVARHSLKRRSSEDIPVHGVVLSELQARKLYTRPWTLRPGAVLRPIMWDTISDAPMSTQHACARFLVSHLAGSGWALFMDGDVLVRDDIVKLFDALDTKYAVYCVKHNYQPQLGVKMDGQIQTRYVRKNWSSVMAFNCEHPANAKLTIEAVNSLPGRDLHRFFWLEDGQIGELDRSWNFLVGESEPVDKPRIVHFTLGLPDMSGFEGVEFADEWRAELAMWAA